MREIESRFGMDVDGLWRAFRVQMVLALAWHSALVSLEEWHSRTRGRCRAALGATLLVGRAATGMIWFSTGWLGASEHGLGERQAALAGATIATAGVKLEVLGQMARSRAAAPGVACCGLSAGRALTLTIIVLAHVAYGALAALTGARQSSARG